MYLKTKNYRDFAVIEDGLVVREFHDARLARKCLPGDIVSIDCPEGCKLVCRSSHPMIAGLLELQSKVKYGFTSRNVPLYLFTPYNESYPSFIVGSSDQGSVNRIGLVRFEGEWTETFPRGTLIRLLDVGADEEALFWTYSPYACEKYKGLYPDPPSLEKRRLISNAFHIDPAGCRDVDDVLNIDYVGENTYVTITIADVSASIPTGHPVDLRAAHIGQSLYQDGQVRNMLPPLLSEGVCSLLQGSKKAGLSLKVCLEDLTDLEWFESAVSVSSTYDYDSIYSSDLVPVLKKMSAAFGLESDDSHVWIEAAMKFYNIQAARLLKKEGLGVLRSHSAPDLLRFVGLDSSLAFLAYSSAQYISAADTSKNTLHWGLQEEAYTHATSPIRRYADLVNQRALKCILFSVKSNSETLISCDKLNAAAKAAKQHDRDYVFLKVLKQQPTGVVGGTVIEIRNEKISVYVKEWSIIVKLKYKLTADGLFLTKDESGTFSLLKGQEVRVAYHSNFLLRSWKRRIILNLEV